MADLPIDTDEEDILIRDNALFFRGPLAHVGVLTLTKMQLAFRPEGALDLFVGAPHLSVPIADMIFVGVKGLNSNVVVATEDRTFRFGGPGARRVLSRLESLWTELRMFEKVEGEFDQGERVLVQGAVDVYVKGVIATRAEAILSDTRLRLDCSGGLEEVLFSTEDFDLPVASLENVELVGLRRRLRIVSGERSLVLGGNLARVLYGSLRALGVTRGISKIDAHTAILENWDVSLFRGPRSIPGVFSISPARWEFTVSGVLDGMLGPGDVGGSIDDLCGVEVVGWPERRVCLRFGKEEFVFGTKKQIERLEAIAGYMRMSIEGVQSTEASPADEGKLSQVDPEFWAAGFDDTEVIQTQQRTLFWPESLHVRVGHVVLTNKKVVFICRCKKCKDPVLAFSIRSIKRREGLEINADEIAFNHLGEEVRFAPLGGDGFVDEFWRRWQGLRGLDEDEGTRGSQPLYRVLGQVNLMKLVHEGEESIFLKNSRVHREERGLGIVLDRNPDMRFLEGAPIGVHIGHRDGMYSFDSVVIEVKHLEVGGETQRQVMILVELPTEINFANRRASYRVNMAMPVQVGLLVMQPEDGVVRGGTAMGRIDDLSVTGCLLSLDRKLENGAFVEVDMPFSDQIIPIRAEVVHVDPPVHPRPVWRFGLRFTGLSLDEQRHLQQEVLRRERALLRQRARVRS